MKCLREFYQEMAGKHAGKDNKKFTKAFAAAYAMGRNPDLHYHHAQIKTTGDLNYIVAHGHMDGMSAKMHRYVVAVVLGDSNMLMFDSNVTGMNHFKTLADVEERFRNQMELVNKSLKL